MSRNQSMQEFCTVTQASSAVAQTCLQQSGWNTERAIDYYFTNQHRFPAAKKGDAKKLEKLFDQYVAEEDNKDEMTGEAMFEFMNDVGVDAEAAESMGLPWKLKAEMMPIITRKEFVNGFVTLGADTVPKIRAEMDKMKAQIQDRKAFSAFYMWLFGYCTGVRRKTVDTEAAVGLWSLVLPPFWKHTEAWCEWVSDEENGVKAVSKDLWQQVFVFSGEIDDDFGNYDPDTSAWPFFIDQFVEHMKEKGAKGGSDDSDDE